jgi:hypothetical protein
LSWSLVGKDGLDQKEIHIGFIFNDPTTG